MANDGKSYGFKRYGGNGFLGDFVGAFETIFMMVFLAMAAELAIAPAYIAYNQFKYL